MSWASCAAPASAESLKDALSAAYGYNPRLDAQRAFQRATDEDVARAMSGYRPTVTGNADIGIERNDQRPSSILDGVTKPRGYGVDAVQPIFRGFRTYNAVNNAEANVRAEREVLRDVERSVLLQAVTAYMDVVRDQELVRLNENNVNVLSRELKAAQDRFAVGEVTRTDVAQAEARRADAVSRLDAARANLRTSRGSYPAGHRPSAERPGLAGPPESFLPQLAAGCHRRQQQRGSAGRRRAVPRAGRQVHSSSRSAASCCRPCSSKASYNDRFGPSKLTDETRQASSMVGRATIPIYEAGDVYARVRQAKQNHLGILQQIEQVRTEQTQNVVAAWSQLEAARAQLRIRPRGGGIQQGGAARRARGGEGRPAHAARRAQRRARVPQLAGQPGDDAAQSGGRGLRRHRRDGPARCRLDRRRGLRLRSQRSLLRNVIGQFDRPLPPPPPIGGGGHRHGGGFFYWEDFEAIFFFFFLWFWHWRWRRRWWS